MGLHPKDIMWNEQTHAQMAARSAPRKRYPSDLTNDEWQ